MSPEAQERAIKPKTELEVLMERALALYEENPTTKEKAYFSNTAVDEAVAEAFAQDINKLHFTLKILDQSSLKPGFSSAYGRFDEYTSTDLFLRDFVSDIVHRRLLELRPELEEEDEVDYHFWDTSRVRG